MPGYPSMAAGVGAGTGMRVMLDPRVWPEQPRENGLMNWMRITVLCVLVSAASGYAAAEGNKPEREEWFMDQALGLFVHWGVDAPLGSVISHSLAGASDAYIERYFAELPGHFRAARFDPAAWARLAELAGFRYVVFGAKHHSGFCMFDTESTDFNVMNTPLGRDVVAEVLEAFRAEGIAAGLYFSPEDFWLLHRQGHPVSRRRAEAQPGNNAGLRAHNEQQLTELLTNYGKIDVLFLDAADTEHAKATAWRLQPETVITRGEMETPEQRLPDAPVPGPWEACFTLGTQWQYKPTNEDYKSGAALIEMLIETRAKGGNLLLNVGPTPQGEIPFEQERRIRELALWLFVNGEAIYEVRPWHVIREGGIWFTRAKDADTLYAFLTKQPEWPLGERREFALKSARATEDTEISVLGQSGELVEYQPDTDATARWEQRGGALRLSVVRAQRLYNNRKWPNPVVVKLTHVEAVK